MAMLYFACLILISSNSFISNAQSLGINAFAMQDAFYKAKDLTSNVRNSEQFHTSRRSARSSMFPGRMGPYQYGSPMNNAIVMMMSVGDAVEGPIAGLEGKLMLAQMPGGPLMVMGNLTGLEKGMYSLFVHQHGDMREGCKSTGSMYEPHMMSAFNMMDPMDSVSHLANFKASDEGMATINTMVPWKMMPLTLTGESGTSIAGRALAVYHNTEDSDKMTMVGCGLIGLL